MSKHLESLLRQAGLLTEPQLRRVQERVAKDGSSYVQILVTEERVSEDAIANAFTERMKVPRARVAAFLPDENALAKVPERLAKKYGCLPLAIEGRVLVLAMVNPIDYRAIQDVEFASALSIRPMVATYTEVMDGIGERYAAEDHMATFLSKVPDAPDIEITADDSQDASMDLAESLQAAEVAPVVKMCNLLIYDAIKTSASDVHLEPTLHDLQVRMRVDGVLRDYTRVPKWLHGPVVSRLKILAKLDIAERRLPQDGRVNVQNQGRSIDLRVSTLPTHFGEKMVLRVLGGVSAPNIDRLGLSADQQLLLEAAIQQPQGMILVTGPTGSGKTTTLYALLAKHHKPEVNIVTVEDPIEYQLAGINQVQINQKAGLTFASALRSILRQDPDVILVGETRDKETAEIAFQAAMTGHMVLSTLHTNSAVATVSRILDLGVDPTILATSLSLVIAQRLVRRICEDCRETYEPDPGVLARVGLTADHGPLYRGRGCQSCGGTGYSGRVGIYEFFRPTTGIRRLINERASEPDIRYAAKQVGMVLLREDALTKIKMGMTSPDEVLRVVQVDETEVPCPNCNALIEADFATCPYCRHSIKSNCASCGQALRLDWKLCPYCNTSAQAPPPAEATEPAATAMARGADTREAARDVGRPPAPTPAPTPAPVFTPGPEFIPTTEFVPTPRFVPAPEFTPAPAVVTPAAAVTPTPEFIPTVEFVPTAVATPAPAGAPAPRLAPVSAATPAPEFIPTVEFVPTAVATPAAAVTPTPEFIPTVEFVPTAVATPASTAVPAPPLSDEAETTWVIPPMEEPAAPSPAPRPAIGTAVREVERTVDPQASQRTLRVLVVDDDPDIRMIVSATLQKLHVPVEVVQAEDGQDGVEKAMAATPDLVVLDVMMPRMDGFETCRALRENVRTAFVPILMLTASADQGSRTKGYLIGTDDYMSKPFMPLDLKMRVARLLRRTYGI